MNATPLLAGMLAIVTGLSIARAAEEATLAARAKYLVLDSRVITTTENARLALGTVEKHPANPLFGQDLPWETQISHMYPNVLFDRDEQLYKMWYYTHIKDWRQDIEPGPLANPKDKPAGNCATLYAISKDGIRWEKPRLDVYHYKGKPTNIVVWGDHGTNVFKDPRDPDPKRRYKLITGQTPHGKIHVAFSPDGIRWSQRQFVAKARGDTHNNALWAATLNRYAAFTREYPDRIRTVVRMESKDFVHWTKPVEVLRGPRTAQTYSMPVFFYAGVYLGLPAIYRIGSDHRVHTELAWSPDTKTWHRIAEGTPLIPLGEEKSTHDWGCIYAAAKPIVLDNQIRIYYSGQPGRHGWNPGHWCLTTLRPDGWAGLEPTDRGKPATAVTRPVRCSGKTLRITADVGGGSVRVTVLNGAGQPVREGTPVSKDATDAAVTLAGGADLAPLRGRAIRLKFLLQGAKLYAFAFSD